LKAFEPVYLRSYRSSRLRLHAEEARESLEKCCLCPRQCHVDRTAGETGYCETGEMAVVASYDAHFGEEEPLVGQHGSGTIFFSHCNLLCNFCQNYDISHSGEGQAVSDEQLAWIMLRLQDHGCHNINLVTPSHVVPQIIQSVALAAEKGLRIPLVYNTSGYDCVETLRLLDGVVDIYMPDFKFWDPDVAQMTCEAPDYPHHAQEALKEMHRQVGDLVLDEDGIAQRGILVRHLVLPENMAGTSDVMKFIAGHISTNTYVNIMAQYRPCGTAHQVPGLDRSITAQEYHDAIESARSQGITRLDQRRRVFVVR
jgi:putative pyruvate formate lyase activating enzyme